MTMYGSMIYREYKIAKSSLILRIILGLLSFAAFMVPILAGALTPDESEEEANYMGMLFFFGLLPMILGTCAGMESGRYKADVAAGWARYSFTLPVTARQQIAASYLYRGLIAAGFLALTLISGYLTGKAVGMDFMLMYFNVFLLAFLVVSGFSEICEIIMMQSKNKQNLKKLGIVAFIICIVLYRLFGIFSVNAEPEGELISDAEFTQAGAKLFDFCNSVSASLIFLGILLTLGAVCFLCKEKSLARREP